MKFHGYFRSSAAYRCRIAFNLKGLEPEFVPVHLRKGDQRSGDYLAKNPQGLVPALEVNGQVLTQSLAIIEWLDSAYPEPAFLPQDPMLKAKARAFALAIACDIHPLQNLRVLNYLGSAFGVDQSGINTWCQRWIGEGLAACEMLVSDKNSTFCFGETPGLADICLAPQFFSAERFGVDTSRMPRLTAIFAACARLPAFAEAHPARQPDSEP